MKHTVGLELNGVFWWITLTEDFNEILGVTTKGGKDFLKAFQESARWESSKKVFIAECKRVVAESDEAHKMFVK